ncbi:hypothetical protein GGQ84_002607 [Desulfitispora alkaliphila]|uniref:DUF2508 family protein n=1 Tax=Desulfitispora alkaliphila TaxID=622674 RepID=UPI003D2448A1
MKNLNNLINHLASQVIKVEESQDDLGRSLEEAKREWKIANQYFNQVTDEKLIDYAIHRMEAAERRYMYLMEEMRKQHTQGTHNEDQEVLK